MINESFAQELEMRAMRAVGEGRLKEAERNWTELVQAIPSHARALAALSQLMFKQGEFAEAKAWLLKLTTVDPQNPQNWISLALACQRLNDEAGEEDAIRNALQRDAHDLLALILKAALLERQGKTHLAATAHGAVASVAPPLEKLTPELRHAVIHARQFQDRYFKDLATFMDGQLSAEVAQLDGTERGRFQYALDVLTGRRKRYESQPLVFHYPGLIPVEFFDRSLFPWMEGVESSTDTIRNEFLDVLQKEQGFTPYLTYSGDLPLNQFAELNNSPRWSAYHLKKSGTVIAEHAAQCPMTMKVLSQVPQPDQPGRTPAAMFSLLKPHTRIPPHTGVTNTRLVTHLPLIVPERCGFRVGNQTREWVPGNAWVFDDTIEHEAWNLSDKLRVILIFDVWHPSLSEGERHLIGALMHNLNAFLGESTSYDM